MSRSNGIGAAIARRLAARGAALLLSGWPAYDEAGSAAVGALDAELASTGVNLTRRDVDLADPAAPAALLAAGRDRHGHLDILVANHTHSRPGGIAGLDAASLDRHLSVNVRATLLLVAAYAMGHDGRHGGRVVLLTSGQGRRPMPAELAYAASKGALSAVTPSLADAVAERGITVNAVNPGPTDTGWADAELQARVAAGFPSGRWGNPDDAARLVAWLCSDEAAWVTGQVLHSEGGFRGAAAPLH